MIFYVSFIGSNQMRLPHVPAGLTTRGKVGFLLGQH